MTHQHARAWRWLRKIVVFLFVVVGGLVVTSFKTVMDRSVEMSLRAPMEAVAQLLLSAEFYSALGRTVFLLVVVGVMAILIGIGLALLIFLQKYAAFVEDIIRLLRPIPSIAMIAVGVMLFSNSSHTLGVFVVFIGSLLPLTVASLDALRCVPQSFRESAITLGKSKWQYIKGVLLPAALPGLFAAVRLVAPIILLLAVTIQYFYQNLGGLGALLFEKQSGLDYASVFCLVAVLALMGWSLETLVGFAETKTLKWRRDPFAI